MTACGSGTPATPPTNSTVVVEGRPLRRRRGGLHAARSVSRHHPLTLTDRVALALDPAVRRALADHWRHAGEMEHASVVAFDDLAARLRRVGAPGELVQRATCAARQEAEHARLCFALASRYAAMDVHAGRLRRPLRMPRRRIVELGRLAVEALRDGMLNEGYAAWLATEQRGRATDPLVIDALDVIARDEAEHAVLSRDVLAWCCAEGGEAVAAAVAMARAEVPEQLVAPAVPTGLDCRALAAHGVVDVDPDGAGYRTIRENADRLLLAA